MLGRKKRNQHLIGQTFQISHQAISCITCKSIKVIFEEWIKKLHRSFMRVAFPSMLLIHRFLGAPRPTLGQTVVHVRTFVQWPQSYYLEAALYSLQHKFAVFFGRFLSRSFS